MTAYVTNRILAICLVLSFSLTGFVVSSAMTDPPTYDLTVDNIPVNFDDDKTMYVDTQTNDRAFLIYNDHLKIRSAYLTFWGFNETYEHEDICFVSGSYAYALVPAINLTLNSITEVNRFEFYAWNGTVGVQCSDYSTNRMTLQVNSTDNATLLIRPTGLTRNYEYRVVIDGNAVGWAHVNSQGYFEYNYTGDWSNHTITFTLIGRITEVPAMYLNIIQIFLPNHTTASWQYWRHSHCARHWRPAWATPWQSLGRSSPERD